MGVVGWGGRCSLRLFLDLEIGKPSHSSPSLFSPSSVCTWPKGPVFRVFSSPGCGRLYGSLPFRAGFFRERLAPPFCDWHPHSGSPLPLLGEPPTAGVATSTGDSILSFPLPSRPERLLYKEPPISSAGLFALGRFRAGSSERTVFAFLPFLSVDVPVPVRLPLSFPTVDWKLAAEFLLQHYYRHWRLFYSEASRIFQRDPHLGLSLFPKTSRLFSIV